jgi:lipoprotein-releasing system permease protein
MAQFSPFLAARYLKPKRTFFSVISVISVLGVTVAITLLIVVIAVMTGFGRELRRKVLVFDAHLLVSAPRVLDEWRPLLDQLRELPGVTAAAPFVQGPVMVRYDNQILVPNVRGIDPELERQITDISQHMIAGRYDLSPDEQGDKVLVGSRFAESLDLQVGSRIIVYAPGNLGQLADKLTEAENSGNKNLSLQEVKELTRPAELTVSGIFQTGRFEYDSAYIVTRLNIAQELYALHDGVQGITIRTPDPYSVELIRPKIQRLLPEDGLVRTWIQLNETLFNAIRIERNVMFIILSVVVVVAAFCVMNSLFTMVTQKRREIGIIKALGATSGQIVAVFLFQGAIVGVIGNVLGVLLALTILELRNPFKEFLATTFRIELFPPSIYQFTEIPAEIAASDAAIICLGAFAACLIAAVVPAIIASRMQPVQALRSE